MCSTTKEDLSAGPQNISLPTPYKRMKIKIQRAQMHDLKFQSHYLIILSNDFSKDRVLHEVYEDAVCPPSSTTLAMELFSQILASRPQSLSSQVPRGVWGLRKKGNRYSVNLCSICNSETLISTAVWKRSADPILPSPQQPVLSLWTTGTPPLPFARNGTMILSQ